MNTTDNYRTMNLLSNLQTLVDAYMAATGSGLGSVSNRIFSDSKRLDRVFSGRADLTLRSFESAISWLSANWPVGLEWPAGIARPARESSLGAQPANSVAGASHA